MSRLRLQVFGGFQVCSAHGQPVAVPAKKVQALFAYLATQPGRPHARGKLAGLLWADSSEAQARASLRQALLVLRKSLGFAEDELSAGTGETVTLQPQCVDVDALEFERLLDDGGVEAVARAASLYAGEFLEALEARAPAFDDWLRVRRQQLRERSLEAMARLLDHHVKSGSIERAVEVALRLLAVDPLREEVHRTLMQLYARQGRQASALRQYQVLRETLKRELGIVPQPDTLRLRNAIERERQIPQPAAPMIEAGVPPTTAELRQIAVIAVEAMHPADDADPERFRSLDEGLVTMAGEIAAQYGGMVDPRARAMVTLLFGVPVAHGDDLARAARCALRLRDTMPDLCLGVAFGPMLVSGVASGSVPQVSGDTAGVAARLAALADAGEVLVSDAAWLALAPLAEGEAHGTLPGPFSRHRTMWKLAGWHAASPSRAGLVGRRAELAQFASALQACLREGAGMAIHLRGEPGIGKTRLVEEFREAAAGQGFACHAGAALDFGSGLERDPVRTIVRGLLGTEDADGTADATLVEQALDRSLVVPAHEGHLFELLQAPQPLQLRPTYDAMDNATRERGRRETLSGLVNRCAAVRPRLIVVEDLHWASARTLADAAVLAAATGRNPLVLVTTTRGDGDPLDAAWRAGAGHSSLVTLDVGPLRWEEASALAAQFCDVADDFILRCVERAGGNPLFLEQLLRAGRDEAAVMPGSVQNVVSARLDQLGADDRHAVRVASVLGQRFSLEALRDLLGREWDVHSARGLMLVEGDDGIFAHALLREGAYASLPRAQRRELHRLAAAWNAQRDAILRAEHLDRAEDAGAAQAYLEAAEAQAVMHRQERALQLAERGLALAGEDGPRFGLGMRRAEILHDIGRTVEAGEAYEAALTAAGDSAERSRAWLGLATVQRVRDQMEAAAESLVHAERAAAELGLNAQLARVHFMRGNLLFPRGDLEGCMREHSRSLELASVAGSAELEAGALGGIGDAEYLRGRMRSALERFGACVELARRHGLKRIEAANLPMVAIARWYVEGSDAACREALQAIELAAAIGHRRAESIAHHGAYMATHMRMDFDAALSHAERALVLARQLGAGRFEAEALAFRGEARASTGQRGAALDDLRAALEIARRTGMAFLGPSLLGLLAVITEDSAVRREALGEGERLLESNGVAHNHLFFRKDAIDANLAAGAWDAAIRHADALEAFIGEERLPWVEFFVARGRVLAERGQGKRDAATIGALQRLRLRASELGLLIAARAIDDALREV